MDWISLILISSTGFIIVWQDFTVREISWPLIPVLYTGILLTGLQQINLMEYLYYIMINGFVLIVLIGVLVIYYWLKNRSINNFLGTTIGLGDLLVFIILCFGFSPINFVVFSLIGLLLTLIFHLLNTTIRPNANTQIPLAGYLSIFLIIISWMQYPFGYINLYNDQFLYSLLTV